MCVVLQSFDEKVSLSARPLTVGEVPNPRKEAVGARLRCAAEQEPRHGDWKRGARHVRELAPLFVLGCGGGAIATDDRRRGAEDARRDESVPPATVASRRTLRRGDGD